MPNGVNTNGSMIDPLSRLISRGAGAHGAVTLMYHSVTRSDGIPEWPWAVSGRRFHDQVSFLADEGWSTPTVSEFVANPQRWTGRTVVITFDDGYADNLAALEEIRHRGMRATCYVVTGAIGREPTWPSRGRPRQRMLDGRALREIHAMGMEIGSHTISHARLTDLPDSRLALELDESKTALEDHLGNLCVSFAYPYGAHDARCIDAVRRAGYASACTARAGWAMRDGDPYRLRRLTVLNRDTTSGLARKLSVGDNNARWTSMVRHASQRIWRRIG